MKPQIKSASVISVAVLLASALFTGGQVSASASDSDVYGGDCSYRDADVNGGWGFNHSTGLSCPPKLSHGMDHIVIQLKGTGTARETTYDTDGDGVPDTTAPCFDALIYNPATGKPIGTGSDCLDVQSNDAGNIRLTGTGFFHLEHGTLVVQGLTTVRPVLQPTTRDGVEFTHITGANGDGGVLYGTGRFKGATGKVRLSGQVDMSRLDSDGQIFFDCIFIVDFN